MLFVRPTRGHGGLNKVNDQLYDDTVSSICLNRLIKQRNSNNILIVLTKTTNEKRLLDQK